MNLVNKLIFVHIPKTAGTSLTDYLSTFYKPDKIYSGQTMLDYQQVEPASLLNFDFLKGHIFYHYIKSNPELEEYQLITILRNPVERVISLYRFWRSHPDDFTNDNTIHPAIRGRVYLAKSLSLLEFVNSDEQIIRNSISNSQARQLCSSLIFEDFHEQHVDAVLNDVKENMNNFAVIGVIEYLPLFVQTLNQHFGFPANSKPMLTNVSDKRELLWSSLDQRDQIAAKIIDLNTVDIKLYEQYKVLQQKELISNS